MGRGIDRAAAAGLCATGYYLFLLGAWDSVPLACVGAFFCSALTLRLLRGVAARRRVSRAQARRELYRLAALDDAAAEAALAPLIRGRWPGGDYRVAPALKHPETSLTCGDILNAWKANRDAARLVIAAPCPCEPRAAVYARTLLDPAVAVVDSRELCRLMRRLPADALPPLPRPSVKARLARAAERFAAYRATPRDALLCAALLALYLLTGRFLCLLAALVIAGRFASALARRRVGRRLFDI